MRAIFALFCLLTTLTGYGSTPELGKAKLRKLVKLPTITFQSNWEFDAERGFILGSSEHEVSNQIVELRAEFKSDNSDAERYLRLSELYSSLNQNTNAQGASTRAAALYRNRVDLRPDDGLLLASLGRALEGANKQEEAESMLRKAIRVAPKESKCWVTLGRFLDTEARRVLFDVSPSSAGSSEAKDAVDKISPAKVGQAQKWINEAGDCFNQAVVIAPKDADVYFRRAIHRSLRNMLLNQIRLASGEQQEDVDLLNNYFSTEGLSDFQRASRLDAQDYHLMANTILYEIYATTAKKGQVNWQEFSWNSLPDKSQSSIRENLTRLENLGESPEPHVAAGALEVLGILQGPVLREKRKSVANLRRAIALDPSRQQAWELVASMLAQSEHYDDLLLLSEDRIRQDDSARSHILMAKAYEKLKRWDESEGEIQIALKESPDDFTLNLSLGALFLKRSQDDSSTLSEADGWLARSQELLKKLPAGQRTRQQIVDLTLTRSIYFALADEVDTARVWVKSVLNQDKDNKLALEILAAMDY